MEILIVDNDPVNRLVTSALLKKVGCSPLCASDEDEGMEILQRTSFDLVLMDVDASDTWGAALVEAIRKSCGPNALTPIIGLSACPGRFDSPMGMDAGMDGYLEKPYDFDELLNLVGLLASSGETPRFTGGLSGWWWNMGTVLRENREKQSTRAMDGLETSTAGRFPGCGNPAMRTALDK